VVTLSKTGAFIGRYGTAGAGPTIVALSQFALSLVVLHGVSAREFGIVTLLLLVSQFGLAVSSALLCAPFQVGSLDKVKYSRAFHSVDAALSVTVGALCWFVGILLGSSVSETTIFAAFSVIQTVRWFARAEAYGSGAIWRTVASDVTYGGLLLLATLLMAVFDVRSLSVTFGALLVCALLALLPFGRRFVSVRQSGFSFGHLKDYWPIWRQHSRWSLAGVVTTEATVNAHAYLVTVVLGPSAFAPIAAASLLIRPVGLAMNALSDFERPRIAKLITASNITSMKMAMRELSLALFASWFFSTLLCGAILQWWPQAIIPAGYDSGQFAIGVGLWLMVALVRITRTSASVAMQAAGNFRLLAYATYASCLVSIAGVLLALFTFGATWSVLGILAGEIVVALMIFSASAASIGKLSFPGHL
jgi:hypothetical protein